MLGSFGGTSSSHEELADQEEAAPPPDNHHQIQHRQLLLRCAQLISHSDLSAAHRLITILSANSSPYGESTERLAHQFTKALSLRINRHSSTAASASVSDEALVQSSYLSLNQVTPFIRFCHLTANQAILEAIEEGQQAIHILDFDIMHGVQWPPLMQAIAERYPPPALRITGTGQDPEILQRTGDRLSKFAQSLGLIFQFHPLLLLNNENPCSAIASSVLLLPNETLAVNFVLYLHRHLEDRERLLFFLQNIKAMNPKVVTLAEREANHNNPLFLQRFVEALDHYSAVFDSLEATLPPNSRERLTVEQIWFGREIVDILGGESGDERRERHERFRSWEMMIRSCGFRNMALSPFALSQAKLLLRLHYPSEGYQLDQIDLGGCFFLGWQTKPLFSVSSWR